MHHFLLIRYNNVYFFSAKAYQEAAVISVNNTTDGLQFKQVTGGTGVSVDTTSNQNQIIVSTEFSEISGDPTPQLGGNLSVKSGGQTFKINILTLNLCLS